MIEVISTEFHRELVFFHHVLSIGEHKVTVRLEVNQAVRSQELTISVHEVSGSKSLGSLLHLRIGEGQPNFTHFAFGKEAVNDFDVCTEKSHILQSFIQGISSTGPHAGTLDIDSDEVLVGVHASQAHGVFAASTSQFKHNRMIVLKEVTIPIALHIERYIVDYRIRVFEHVRIIPHICKLR